MDSTEKRFGLIALAVVAALLLVAALNLRAASQARPPSQTISYSAMLDAAEHGDLRSATLEGQLLQAETTRGNRLLAVVPGTDPSLLPLLRSHHVTVWVRPTPVPSSLPATALATLLPMILLVGTLWFFNRRAPAGTTGRSASLPLARRQVSVTFADVAGVDEARDSLQEIVDFLRNPKHAGSLGGRIPRGVLLAGPPGTGKTLLARAIAGEANVPFFSLSGSDFVEMFVGVGASRVRAMFAQARKHAPCILFIDEIDAVGRRRGQGGNAGSDEREQTLNQLLVGLDGFDTNEGVIMIAATNRPDVLDPALLRPGRFDREIVVDNPDRTGREQILAVHARRVTLAPAADLSVVARGTPGFSGADLMNLVNEAALLAARRGLAAVGPAEFEDAKDTVTMGAERRAQLMTPQERQMTAWREAGRALVALLLPGADPVHKATIVTRGRSTGMVKQLPEQDAVSYTEQQLKARLAIHMAGRAAEQLAADGLRTSGSEFAIEAASRLARRMVTRYGFSESLGPICLAASEEDEPAAPMAQSTAAGIDVAVRLLLEEALMAAEALLRANIRALHRIAEALLRQETLTGEQVRLLLAAPSA